MIACTLPASTVRSTPLRMVFSSSSRSTCRFLISNMFSLLTRVLSWGRSAPSFDSIQHDSRATGRDHQHRLAHNLVIQIDADNGIGPKRRRAAFQFVERSVARILQLAFIGPRAATDDIGYLGKEIPKDIRPHDRLAHNDPAVIGDLAAFDAVGCSDDHLLSPLAQWAKIRPRNPDTAAVPASIQTLNMSRMLSTTTAKIEQKSPVNAADISRPRTGTYPTDPSSEIATNCCASMANSIGSACNTSLQNPLTTKATASSSSMPR